MTLTLPAGRILLNLLTSESGKEVKEGEGHKEVN